MLIWTRLKEHGEKTGRQVNVSGANSEVIFLASRLQAFFQKG